MSENEALLNRRAFLTITGVAAVAAGCSPVKSAQKLVPYLDPPVDQVPGVPVFYRTVCRECPAGCGVTARTREGRVVKLEGNPEDPVSKGALCARGQASVQMLYAPDRVSGPMKRNAAGVLEPIEWDAALEMVAAALKPGKKVRILSRAEPGSAGEIQRAFATAIGATRMVLEPMDPWALRVASMSLYGVAALPSFELAGARTVVSFGADFLETWVSPVEMTGDFAAGRGKSGEARTRLWWVGPRLSATGASADRWLSARPGTEWIVALGLVRWLALPANGVSGLPSDAAAIASAVAAFTPELVEARSGVSRADLEALGRELAARRPSALLGPGVAMSNAPALASAVLLANHLLGNAVRLDVTDDPPSPPQEVAAMLGLGIDVLLLHHADPAGALPASAGAVAALGKIPLVVSLTSHLDASTRLAHLVLPDHHPLEAWGDLTTRAGRTMLQQPAMTLLGNSRATGQVLIDLAAKAAPAGTFTISGDYGDWVRARNEASAKAAGSDARAAIGRGGLFTPSPATPVPVLQLAKLAFEVPAQDPGPLTLAAFPTALRFDGRTQAPWLHEVADSTSTVAWVAWAEISPATAARLGLEDARVVALATSAGRVELPVYVYPPLRDDTVGIPLGGPEAMALFGADGTPLPVTITPLGYARLPRLEGMPQPHAGALFAKASSSEGPELKPLKKLEMYDPPRHPKHRWAMTIDLDKCTGCNACTVACYAENNLPVLGPERIDEGRSMAWLKLERFFDDGPQPRVGFVPMMCQQCDNAPCEVVCPVDATYHTAEGLNAQVYNRCVGTRYCANNCPYKVRAFNFQQAAFPAPLNLQLNPDVTVRSVGVMEKCTFCVQRIRFSENVARNENRDLNDGEITTACAQTCPAKAIVFGDAQLAGSSVAASRKDPRGFRALEELNTRPAVTYLVRPSTEKEKNR